MTIARAHSVDTVEPRWSHCITCFVRRALLLGEGPNDRKSYLQNRSQDLAQAFAVSVGGYSVQVSYILRAFREGHGSVFLPRSFVRL
jgi:hypothetical protein